MIIISKLNELSEKLYAELLKLWELAGISNPARSDSFAALNNSLVHTGCLLLAQDGEKLLGSAWLSHDFRRLYIHHMAVLPVHQNKGLGTMLLTEALAIAKELGYQAKLEVHQDNSGAKHLYENFGFTELSGYLSYIKRDT
ncbi:MAG: GNAT family N-acetyltransferase [Candidatus Cloacimonas sp.]|jgi:ribosomal protein S18 acetylase RimI-like enzyme|nr:GNAT family N-acetyltransferase [Candidatus Cloacimonas sp.]